MFTNSVFETFPFEEAIDMCTPSLFYVITMTNSSVWFIYIFFLVDIEEYAKRIGIDIQTEPDLLYLARDGLKQPLPKGWKPV